MKRLFSLVSVLSLTVVLVAAPKPLRVLVLGDDPMMVSNEASQSVGYAELLQPYFAEEVHVDVQASFELLPADAAALLANANKGDVVMISKQYYPVESMDEVVLTNVYLSQLESIAQAAKKKGVKLVWLTAGCVRYFTSEGIQVHRAGSYPEVLRRLCKRDEMALIDLEDMMYNAITEMGQEASAEYFVPVEPAVPAAAEKAAREGNLLTEKGAEAAAAMVVNAIRNDKKNPLNKRLKAE